MAEKSFQTPHHFFEYVVVPNIRDLKKDPLELRLAYNCVMSIDSFASHIYEFLEGQPSVRKMKDDSEFKQVLAKTCFPFEIIRDVAKAQKHVKLTRGSPQTSEAKQMKHGKMSYGEGTFGTGTYGGIQILVETNDRKRRPLLSLIDGATEFLNLYLKEQT